MANRYPLVLDVEDGNKIKELPQGDSLYLFGNTIEEVGNINSVGIINAAELRVNDQVVGPTAFTQLTDTPANYSNQNNKIVKVNDSGTGLDFVDAQDLGTLGSGSLSITGDIYPNTNNTGSVGLANKKWNTVRATNLQGDLLDANGSVVFDSSTGKITGVAISGSNISIFTNDANYITLNDLSGINEIDIKGDVYGSDDTLLIDASSNAYVGTLKSNLVAEDDTVIVDYSAKVVTADLHGNLFSQDSSILIDYENSQFYGDFNGNLTGNILGGDSSIVVDYENSNHYGTFIGSVYRNLPESMGDDPVSYVLVDHQTGDHYGQFIGVLNGSVYAENSSIIVDAENSTHYGEFVGNLTGNFSGEIVGGNEITMLETDNATLNGTFLGNVMGQDSVIIVDSSSSTHYGTFVGSFVGNDSTLLLDGDAGEVVGPIRDMTVLGETGNTPSNTVSVNSWLEVTVNGNTRYIPLYA